MKISEDGVLYEFEYEDVKAGKISIPEGVTKIELKVFPKQKEEEFAERWSGPIGGVVNEAIMVSLRKETKEISFPSTLKEISSNTFSNFANLEKVVLPDSVEVIGAKAFENCEKIKSVILSRKLRTIEEGTFRGCHSLKYIIIPDSVRKIKKYAFKNCESIESIRLSNNIEEVESDAFYFSIAPSGSKREIKDIQELVLPNQYHGKGGVSNIYFNVRNGHGTDHILTIVMPRGESSGHLWAKNRAVYRDSETYSNEMRYGSEKEKNALALVRADENDNVFEMRDTVSYRGFDGLEIPKGIKIIGEYACSEWSKLESVIIPEGVIGISRGAFAHCENLEEVFLPKSLKYIDAGAFTDCPALAKIDIPKHVKIIGENAFKDCTGLEKVRISSDKVVLERGAFENCESLEQIPDLSRISIIGDSAFKGVGEKIASTIKQEDKRRLVIYKNVKSLGKSCFEGCKLFSSVELDERSEISVIPARAFCNCTSMEKIKISPSVKVIGDQAFENCTSLFGSVKLPKGIEKIGRKAFRGCITMSGRPYIDGRVDVAADAFETKLIDLPDDSASFTVRGGRLYVRPESNKSGFSIAGLIESVKMHKEERKKRRQEKEEEEIDWR